MTTIACLSALLASAGAFANGGPFLVRRPNGDPAAKGVAAPMLPDLMPGRESRLEVVREDLSFRFTGGETRPLVHVTARYTIKNPTDQGITLAVGFPILRGIYVEYSGGAMGSFSTYPAYRVQLDGREVGSTVISNSDLFDRIRGDAWKKIVAAMDADPALRPLRARMAAADPTAADAVRTELEKQLLAMRWEPRDAALLADLMRAIGPKPTPLTAEQHKPIPWPYNAAGPRPRHQIFADQVDFELGSLGEDSTRYHMGALSSMGELKATQLLSHVAARLAPGASTDYQRLFTAWGGDVREQAVDPGTGVLRPRRDEGKGSAFDENASLYARLDYFQPNTIMQPARRQACERIVKNLPVVFTFAPMNIIRTELTFPARSTRVVTYDYSQFSFDDLGPPASHQLAYVVHPASFWKTFGPISVTVQAPQGVPVRASIPMRKAAPHTPSLPAGFVAFTGELREKTGELYLSVDCDKWKAGVGDGEKYRIEPPALMPLRHERLELFDD
jgi:hypothetical protein